MTIKLRVLADKLARPLPLAQLRDKLGGLAAPCERAGEVLAVDDLDAPVVLLDVDDTRLHVWLGDGRVKMVEPARAAPFPHEVSAELSTIVAAARAFRAVREGDRVRFRDQGREGEGLVADRCRFGVVVARGDGSMLGVGFSRVTRLPDA